MQFWLLYALLCDGGIAFWEQAAAVSAAWANEPELKALGVQGSLCVIAGKKLARRVLIAICFAVRLCMHGCACMAVHA